MDRFYENLNLLNLTNDVVKISSAGVAHLIVILESFCKRNVQRKFWQIFRTIRYDFNRSDHTISFGSYFARICEFFVIMIVIVCMHISRFSDGILCSFLLLATLILAVMAQFRAFQYLFFIYLLKHQLNVVEKEAKSLADASENGTVSLERLKWIRMHYDLVYELSTCINEVFGWSNLVSFSYLFLRMALDLIWNYSQIIRKIGIHFEGTPCLRVPSIANEFHQNDFRCSVDHSFDFAACLSI